MVYFHKILKFGIELLQGRNRYRIRRYIGTTLSHTNITTLTSIKQICSRVTLLYLILLIINTQINKSILLIHTHINKTNRLNHLLLLPRTSQYVANSWISYLLKLTRTTLKPKSLKILIVIIIILDIIHEKFLS